ncbi:MAG: hypothetical protein ACRELF_11895 [Gemmataceae bacterium]
MPNRQSVVQPCNSVARPEIDRTQPWAASPDGSIFAVVRQNGKTIGVWSAVTGKLLGQYDGGRAKVTCLAFDNTGTRLVTGYADCTALVWPVRQWT